MKKIYILLLSILLMCPAAVVSATELDPAVTSPEENQDSVETPDLDDTAASPDDMPDQSDSLALCAYYLEQINTYEFGTKDYQDAVLLYLQSYQEALAKLDALSSVNTSLAEINAVVKGSVGTRLTDIADINKKEYTLLSDMYKLLDKALSDDVVTDEEVQAMNEAAQAELDFRTDLLKAVQQINETLVSQNSLLQDQLDMLSDYLSTVSSNELETVSGNDIRDIMTTPIDEYDISESLLFIEVILLILLFVAMYVFIPHI